MAIATHDSHGIDICMALVQSDLTKKMASKLESALILQSNATKFLLSTMEGRHDLDIIQRILCNIDNHANLINSLKQLYATSNNPKISAEVAQMARSVGHDIYILSYQLGLSSPPISKILKEDNDEGLVNYREHTGQIEVVMNGKLEHITFTVPHLCEFLPLEIQQTVETKTKRDEQGSKIPDFFSKMDGLYQEMVII